MMLLPDYEAHIPPWTPQQLQMFMRSYDKREFALFCEPRTGKSKPIVDTCAYHFEHRHTTSPLPITGVLIIAWPNGVHAGWIYDAFPDNMPERIPWRGFIYRADKFSQVGVQADFEQFLHFPGLAVFTINAEALPSETCRKAIGRFLTTRKKVGLVADESSFMVGANNRRTKICYNLSQKPHIQFKRILDGTPAADGGPFDYFTQLRFMNPAILGITTNSEFRQKYAEWEVKVNHNTMKSYPSIALDDDGNPKFRNIEELQDKIAGVSYRVTFAECFSTPRKVYQKRYFELGDEQRRLYRQAQEEMRVELRGATLDINGALARMTRLQQICSNYFPEVKQGRLHDACEGEGCDACDGGVIITKRPAQQIETVNPRLEALRAELRYGKPSIVWCRFRQDAADVYALGQELNLNPHRYDGTVNNDMKRHALDEFQGGRSQLFVGNQRSAGRGIPLWKAAGHIYYSNTFSLRDRLQSEDRAEIGHRTVGTFVVDILAENSIDDGAIIPALRAKMDVSTYVMRDPARLWI